MNTRATFSLSNSVIKDLDTGQPIDNKEITFYHVEDPKKPRVNNRQGVHQYTLDGVYITSYESGGLGVTTKGNISMTVASVIASAIKNKLSKIYLTRYGFIWIEDLDGSAPVKVLAERKPYKRKPYKPSNKKMYRGITVMDKETGEKLEVFENLEEAVGWLHDKFQHISKNDITSSITRCINGKIFSTRGFVFKL
jgi:hypothetical protein